MNSIPQLYGMYVSFTNSVQNVNGKTEGQIGNISLEFSAKTNIDKGMLASIGMIFKTIPINIEEKEMYNTFLVGTAISVVYSKLRP